MARKKMTPPYGVRGYWEVDTPWTIKEINEYQCVAIRSFTELSLKGIDVYREFYQPMQLSESHFQADDKVSANIVVLQDDYGEFIHIPDTYIRKFPNVQEDNFKRIVLSVDLGALPVGTGVSHIVSEIKKQVEVVLGRSVAVKQHLAPLVENKLTPAELKREESVRRAAVSKNKTPGGKYMDLNKRYGDLKRYAKTLEDQVKGKGSETTAKLTRLEQEKSAVERNLSVLQTKYDNEVKKSQTLQEKETKQALRISKLERAMISAGIDLPT